MSLLTLLIAASAPLAPAADEIVVTAPCRLTGRQLRPAFRAYARERAARAPGSTLFFEADPGARRAGVTPASLRIRDRGVVTRVHADAYGRFVIPAAAGKDWEISGPCHDGALAISPLVMSPGTSAEDRRLGDMRLQCEVGWQIVKQQLGAASGVFMALIGGCKSSRMAIYTGSARPIAEASVVGGASATPVTVSADGTRYRVPVGDKKLPDDTRVRFRFR